MTPAERNLRLEQHYQLDLLARQLNAMKDQLLDPIVAEMDLMSLDELKELRETLPEGPAYRWVQLMLTMQYGVCA